ncbi:hypothetical protein CALVIDRAFT_540591 [Calocera viscosa TUFC12733]|uniref:Uncharacterized protein n=1 Tax=Calocera viscosa (strain TUFC12733) TaxID=1330018 RepID=A0A167ISF6_CALVF|nr:hypothetical protein CALVIDRAFT_540591 [Calocera viscosa TUFC12733]
MTSTPPSPEELRACDDVSHWNQEIASLETLLLDAKTALAAAEERAFALRARRAPINRVPDDILLEIFHAGAVDLGMSYDKGGIRMEPFQVLIAAVCPRWRSLAHGTPSLWSRIRIQSPYDLDSARLQLWLRLSQPSTLSLVVSSLFGSFAPFQNEQLKALLQDIAPRLLYLRLDQHLDTCRAILLGIIDKAIRLEHVVVSQDPWVLHETWPSSSLFSGPLSSRLSIASFSGPSLLLPLFFISVLRHLDICFPDDKLYNRGGEVKFFSMLGDCKSLVSLRLANCRFLEIPPPDVQMPALMELKTIEVTYLLDCRILAWIADLVAPRLSSITLSCAEVGFTLPIVDGWELPDHRREESFWEGVKDLLERDKALLFSRHARLEFVELQSRISISADALQSVAVLEAARLPHLRCFTWGYSATWEKYGEAPNPQNDWSRAVALRGLARAYQALGSPLTSITVYHPLRPTDEFNKNYMPEIVSDDFLESCLDNWGWGRF